MSRASVLVVDDDRDLREALVEALEEEFEVGSACDGRDALDVMKVRAFDVVLLDLAMPNLCGAGYLGEHRQHYASVSVLLMSANLGLRERAAELGANDYIAKPFRIARLNLKLRALVTATRSARGDAPAC